MKYEDIQTLKSFEQFNGTGTEQADYGEWRNVFRDVASQIGVARRDNLINNLQDIYIVLDNYLDENYIDIEIDMIEFQNKQAIIMYNLDNNNLLFVMTIDGNNVVVKEFDGQYYQERDLF